MLNMKPKRNFRPRINFLPELSNEYVAPKINSSPNVSPRGRFNRPRKSYRPFEPDFEITGGRLYRK